MDFLIHIGIGLLGVLLYNVIAFRDYLNRKDLTTKVFWNSYLDSSKAIWIWSLLVLIVIGSIVGIEPTTADAIKTLTGWDIEKNNASFFTLALAVSAFADAKKK